jgi:hypothetical protein
MRVKGDIANCRHVSFELIAADMCVDLVTVLHAKADTQS